MMEASIFRQNGAASLAWLKVEWQELAGHATVDKAVGTELFTLLAAAYDEVARHYHNLGHIRQLLAWAAEFKALVCAEDYDALRFAVWFHDCVYDTQRTDNEEQSAAFAVSALQRLQTPEQTIELVRAMILATKTHQAAALPEAGRLFLDLDLLILGAAADSYDAYAQAIRQEYEWVPEAAYRQGRRRVLESFLQRERLYFTDVIASDYEERARRNLARELAALANACA